LLEGRLPIRPNHTYIYGVSLCSRQILHAANSGQIIFLASPMQSLCDPLQLIHKSYTTLREPNTTVMLYGSSTGLRDFGEAILGAFTSQPLLFTNPVPTSCLPPVLWLSAPAVQLSVPIGDDGPADVRTPPAYGLVHTQYSLPPL